MSNALGAFGTLLKIGDGGGPETFTTIAEVTDIKGPTLSLDTIEATSHDSANATKEFVAGLKDAGEVTFSVNFIPTNATQSYATGLIKDWYNRTKRNFRMVFPDTTTWNFAAFVTRFEPAAPVDGKLAADVTLKIASSPTLA